MNHCSFSLVTLLFSAFGMLDSHPEIQGFLSTRTHTGTGAPEQSLTLTRFVIRGEDSEPYSVSLVTDPDEEPVCYHRYLVTGVCASKECKPITVNLYWDLLGNYVHYELPSEAPLTKVDHIPFDEEDYKKLHEILTNVDSILQDFDVDVLNQSKEDESLTIDAMTGATPKTIEKDVIAGALYTSYTLWHIANGSIQEELIDVTRNLVDDQLLRRFLASRNHHYRSWAIDWVLSRPDLFEEFTPDLMNLLRGDNVFAAQQIIECMPGTILREDPVQKELYDTYRGGSYRLKTALLKRLQHVPLNVDLLVNLSSELLSSNEELFFMIVELLSQADSLPDEALTHMTQCLESRPRLYAERLYAFLSLLPEKSSGVAIALEQYRGREKRGE